MQAVQDTMCLLAYLGLCVNVEKSTIKPTQKLEHLGYVIDTTTMLVSVSESKLQRLGERSHPLHTKPSIRQVMCFLGTVESCMLGVKAGNIQKFPIEAEKNEAMN